MTYRLIALMSIVLLLCLATFAFATKHYQDEVMQELPRTVTRAGQAAFRSLESHTGDDHPFVSGSGMMVFEYREDGEATDETVDVRVEPDPTADKVHVEVRRIIRQSGEDSAEVVIVGEHLIHGPGIARQTIEALDCDGEDCLEWIAEEAGSAGTQLIRIDAIRTEDDPDRGLVMRIPRYRAWTGGDGEALLHQDDNVFVEQLPIPTMVAEKIKEEGLTAVVGEDVVLPIPTGDYLDLFTTFRKKSLGLFIGVFAVGLVLTSGLASRFTRPVRRLDDAIRKLSDGDLDVEVPVRGSDEVARLGKAFNEMTGKLRENRERARELTRREKLSALGRLAAGVAHDVRNPLHSINLTLQHLAETSRPEGSDRGAEFDRSLDIIRQEIRRLDGLVVNFLRFAGGEPHERQDLDLAALLEETATLVRKEAEWRKVRLTVDAEDGVPAIRADVEAMRSAVLNLVLNAFEAMPDGGDLTLAVRREGGDAVVEITDNGIGIPEDRQDRVFDFGYSGRDGGNGLGLAIVHQCVVEEHGGRVSLHSEEEKGTRVTLTFPEETS